MGILDRILVGMAAASEGIAAPRAWVAMADGGPSSHDWGAIRRLRPAASPPANAKGINPDGARFCGQCGTSLVPASSHEVVASFDRREILCSVRQRGNLSHGSLGLDLHLGRSAAIIGATVAVNVRPGPTLVSAIQHFAAGVVFAAAAEILPDIMPGPPGRR